MLDLTFGGTLFDMELYQLRSFIKVADTGNLTQAAEQLFTSQPAVSAHIKALEEEFEMKLFVRSAKGMSLTDNGLLLKEKAIKVLDSSLELKNQARSLKEEVSGTIKIGLNADSEYLRLTKWHNDLLKQYPRLKIELAQDTSYKLINDVESGLLDGSFVSRGFQSSALDTIDLFASRAVVAAAPQWKEQLDGAGVEDLAELPWIKPEKFCIYHQFIDELFASSTKKLNNITTTSSEDATLKLLLSGVGLAFIRDDEAENLLKNKSIVTWDQRTFSMPLRFVFQKKRVNDPLIKIMLDTILQQFSEG